MSGLSSVKNKPIKIMGENKIVIELLELEQKAQTQYFSYKIFISSPAFLIFQRIKAVWSGLFWFEIVHILFPVINSLKTRPSSELSRLNS